MMGISVPISTEGSCRLERGQDSWGSGIIMSKAAHMYVYGSGPQSLQGLSPDCLILVPRYAAQPTGQWVFLRLQEQVERFHPFEKEVEIGKTSYSCP